MQRNHYSFIAIFSTIYYSYYFRCVWLSLVGDSTVQAHRFSGSHSIVSNEKKKRNKSQLMFHNVVDVAKMIWETVRYSARVRLSGRFSPCTGHSMHLLIFPLVARDRTDFIRFLFEYYILWVTAVLNTDGNWISSEQITKFTFESISLVRFDKSINNLVCSLLPTRHWLRNYAFQRIRIKWRIAKCFFTFPYGT